MPRPLIAIIGDGTVGEDDPRYSLALETGRHIIDLGGRVLCGGLSGVMEAACRGAHRSTAYREGDTVGLLPGTDPRAANGWVDIAIPTGLGHARNVLVASADAVIAIGGAAGTLSELAFAWLHQRPVIAIPAPGWSGELAGRDLGGSPPRIVIAATDPAQAARLALDLATLARK